MIDAYRTRAKAYAILGDNLSAVLDYSQVIRLDPSDAYAYAGRAEILAYQGELDKGLADANRAIELAPKDVQGYVNRGLIYFYKKEFEKALADYTKAVELEPDDALHYRNRGLTYEDLGQHELAIADYDQAVKLEADDMRGYALRGDGYQSLGKGEAALADYKKALSLADKIDDIASLEKLVVRLSQPLPQPVPAPPLPANFERYEDSGGKFSFDYPKFWIVAHAKNGDVTLSDPIAKDIYVVVYASQHTGSASISQLMEAAKRVLVKTTGYTPVGDESLSIGGLAAAKHTYRIINSPEFDNINTVGVVVVARRGDNFVILMGFVTEKVYADKKATLDKIVASLVSSEASVHYMSQARRNKQ